MHEEWMDSEDAGVWTDNFLRIRQEVLDERYEDIASDWGTMVAWFANAMAAAERKWEMKEMLRNAGVETFEEYLEQLGATSAG